MEFFFFFFQRYNAKKKKKKSENYFFIIILIIIIINNNTWAYQDLQNNYLTFFSSVAATFGWKGHLHDMQEKSASMWTTSSCFLPFSFLPSFHPKSYNFLSNLVQSDNS
jgi:hypothetical protein